MTNRHEANNHYDLCVIGGGINGAAIARDAAGRGLSVLLVEGDDLGSGTSSSSTKLVHGGLRYLEHREFGLVREALKEREILLKIAPHITRKMDFVLPVDRDVRPLWLLRLGLFLYDRMGGKDSFPPSRLISLLVDHYGLPLRENFKKGFVYSDGWVDDSRLVVLNAVDAHEKGAKIHTRTICTALEAKSDCWEISLHDRIKGSSYKAISSMVVNATGPWVGRFLDGVGLSDNDHDLPRVRLVKGSHILLPRQYEGEQVYILQQPDKRVVFTIPYEQDYTLVGTTEVEYDGDPGEVIISEDEISYLCEAYNRAFKKPVLPEDVVFTYSGVRPLLCDKNKNTSANTRSHLIYHHKRYAPPMLSLFGGKLTTYRLVAEEAVDKLLQLTGKQMAGWTSSSPLPGGDFPEGDFAAYYSSQKEKYPWLPEDILYHYVEAYGSRMDLFLEGKESLEEMGCNYGEDIYEAEITYLINHEFAKTDEDILWRRSKLGLHISDETAQNIAGAVRSIVG